MSELTFMSGVFASFMSAKVLKNIIKESRPVPSKTYGMPSSRSTVITFIVLYLLQNKKLSNRDKALIVAMGSVLIYMKYHSLEHSIQQLIAGAILGSTIYHLIQVSKAY
jgi:acid phosphatase family membrane protein YuiD